MNVFTRANEYSKIAHVKEAVPRRFIKLLVSVLE